MKNLNGNLWYNIYNESILGVEKMEEYLKIMGNIVKKDIVIINRYEIILSRDRVNFHLNYEEVKKAVGTNYKGYSIFTINRREEEGFLCIQSDEYKLTSEIELILKSLEIFPGKDSSFNEGLINYIENNKDVVLDSIKEKLTSSMPMELIYIDNVGTNVEEISEIFKESLRCFFIVKVGKGLLAGVEREKDEKSLKNRCVALQKNIMADVYLETSIIIGGSVDTIEDIKNTYEYCKVYSIVKEKYSVEEKVLNYEAILPYLLVESLNNEIKNGLINRIFSKDFKTLLNEELRITIDEFFKNDLNITDTSMGLYIHRNTLLYRLDKIYKSTGFDLRKFNHSWLFRVAWIEYKAGGIRNYEKG